MAVASKYNKYSVPPPAARATLREFAVSVHDRDGVAAACVTLQDRFDLDVNVLLLAAYVGAVRGQVLTAQDIGNARTLIDAWHTDVVRPLRAVRRLLKSGPAPAPNPPTEDVRGTVARAELDAELVELDVLGDWVAALAHDPDAQPSAELAVAAMELAVRSYSTDQMDGEAHRALRTIADATQW